ncbi:hypothetical protein BDZ97DRAFT_1654599 [Flammula alnicola]|nr:hypothetical protein BDZ97DRAFT_1667020 [Flammula alnicola]KAF8968842.1 hypothetical protein BDZ97DRAFT_1654599 [Flammula alnicola]
MPTRMKTLAAVELLPQGLKHLHPNLELSRGQGRIHDAQDGKLGTTTLKAVPEGAILAILRTKTVHPVHLKVKDL